MSRIVTSFDPGAATLGSFSANIIVDDSSLLILNESAYFLKLDLGTSGGQIIVQPFVNRLIRGIDRLQDIAWYQSGSISPQNSPVSICYVIAFDPNEEVSDAWNMPLQRLMNVGNDLVTSTSAANGFEQDFLTGFVLTGLVSTKDGVTANQLDVTSGIAFLVQSDSSLGRIAPLASRQLTSAINSTYFLDLNPDGSFSFATSHSTVSNHLTLATVTTDGSGNIATVTDARQLNSTMLPAMAGLLTLPKLGNVTATLYKAALDTTSGNKEVLDITNAAAGGHHYGVFIDTDDALHIFDFTGGFDTLLMRASDGGMGIPGPLATLGGQASAGAFGVPVIVAQAIQVTVTVTTNVTVLAFTPAVTGLYRVSGFVQQSNGSATTLSAAVQWTDAGGAHPSQNLFWGASKLSAFSVGAGSNSVAFTSFTVYATSLGQMLCLWQDSAGTPNDKVNFLIERLS